MYICIVAALVATMPSCKKEKNPEGDQKEQPDTPDTPDKPDPEPEPEEPQTKTLTFTASAAEGYKPIEWAVDDAIAIWWEGGDAVLKAKSAGETTTFEMEVAADFAATDFLAVYPADAATGVSDYTIKFSVPALTDGSNADIYVAASSGDEMNLQFETVAPVITFEVESGNYAQAVFKSLVPEEPIAGYVPLTYDQGSMTVGDLSEPSSEIRVNLSGAGEYSFAVLPGVMTKGLSFALVKGETPGKTVYKKAEYILDGTSVLDLGKLDKYYVTDYYASESGSGSKDGLSAGSAFGIEELRAFIAQPVMLEGEEEKQIDALAYEMAALLDGATIHFEDGTYVLPAEGVTSGLKMEFTGYPKPVEVSFTGSSNAVLSGGGASRVLLLGNQTDITVKGMSIKDGNLVQANEEGAGVMVAAGGSGTATLNLEGTVFANNQNNTSVSGGAIRCAKGTVNATGCVFEADNYARNGGSIYTNNDNAVVNCVNCTFKSHSYNTGGAANNSKGRQTYVKCVFDGCYTETGAGAAIHANAAKCTVEMDQCQFLHCVVMKNNPMASTKSKSSGIISIQLADVTISNSLFEDCEGVSGAIINVQQENGIFKCFNTVFKGNRGADRGLVQVNASAANNRAPVAFFNNCTFYDNTMRTNEWGFILHGGNPGAACFNNCTFYGNTRQTAGGNGVGLNTDGSIILLNSTYIGADDLVSVRANTADERDRVLIANSIVLNTSEGKPFIASDKLKPAANSYNSIMGSVYTAPDNYSSHNDVMDATLATLGGSFDTGKFVYAWNGPADGFTKMSASDFETIVKGAANNVLSSNSYLEGKTLGEAFYEWLTSLGAVGKDALGTSRGSSWWPGAYQKN